ncbi:MAG: hypothetical protein NTW08_06915 [Gammaproteobacteria bacterium]|nr:hypothetical protein [Gammaproteobacteria bacterium]
MSGLFTLITSGTISPYYSARFLWVFSDAWCWADMLTGGLFFLAMLMCMLTIHMATKPFSVPRLLYFVLLAPIYIPAFILHYGVRFVFGVPLTLLSALFLFPLTLYRRSVFQHVLAPTPLVEQDAVLTREHEDLRDILTSPTHQPDQVIITIPCSRIVHFIASPCGQACLEAQLLHQIGSNWAVPVENTRILLDHINNQYDQYWNPIKNYIKNTPPSRLVIELLVTHLEHIEHIEGPIFTVCTPSINLRPNLNKPEDIQFLRDLLTFDVGIICKKGTFQYEPEHLKKVLNYLEKQQKMLETMPPITDTHPALSHLIRNVPSDILPPDVLKVVTYLIPAGQDRPAPLTLHPSGELRLPCFGS